MSERHSVIRYNWAVKRELSQHILLVLSILVLTVATACSAEVVVPDTPTPTEQVIITATLPPTQTPPPSLTVEPATATPIVAPAEGQTISQLNVRSEPSAESNLLGTIQIATNLQILGKDPTSGWWMIVYPESPTGTGWVTAQFVQVSEFLDVPVLGGSASGPGNTPIADAGPTVESGGEAVPSPAPTMNLATAYPDDDSVQSPAVSITLSKASMRSFNYSSDISSPEGDPEDWVQFTLDGQFGQQTNVAVILNCSGSSALNVELIQNNTLLQGWQELNCGQPSQLQLFLYAGSPYYLRLYPSEGSNPINYIAYTVTVQLAQ